MAKEKEHKEGEDEDETVYDEEGRSEMVADDELSPEEAGFMKGYEDSDEDPEEEPEEKSDKDKETEEETED